MIEMSGGMLAAIIVVGLFFVFSLICNLLLLFLSGFLGWFSYNSIQEISELQDEAHMTSQDMVTLDNIDLINQTILELGAHLEEIWSMDRFQGEPQIEELMAHIRETLRQIDDYRSIYSLHDEKNYLETVVDDKEDFNL